MASSKIAEEKHLEMTHRQRDHSFLQFPSLEHLIWQQKKIKLLTEGGRYSRQD